MEERQITALIGPSGCGKSTFLRCLNRMNDTIPGARAEGSVTIDGMDVYAPETDVVELRKRVGMVFQRPNPFPQSIFDNVAFGPRVLGSHRGQSLTDEVEKSLRAADLWDEVRDSLRQDALGLSLGQQQRLCIARVVAVAPEVILMDEPCSALDPIATLRVEELMRTLKETLHDRHRHAQHAAGGARVGQDGVFLAERAEGGHPGGVRGDAAGVHQPARQANGRLYHGKVRVRAGFERAPRASPASQGGYMPREKFEHDLRRLQDEVVELGAMAERAVTESVSTLKKQDFAHARELIEGDRLINEKRYAIENEALTLIATQQPMAGDLRTLAAIFEIATELERIADYAKGIANIALMIGNEVLIKPLVDVPRMAEKACDMLHRSLEAFLRQDVEEARGIPKEDVEVDALYDQIYRELITYIMADPKAINQATRLTWVAHNLERVADRVGNICERIVFSITGHGEELDAPLPS